MARDAGLEELVREYLGDEPGLTGQSMFGGWCWLLDGHLLCGANQAGVLVRLGKGNDAWALALDSAEPLKTGQRVMAGWVRVPAEAFADDTVGRRLIHEALAFVRGLPPK